MAARVGLGPIFALECLRASRRWQVYAGRSLLVASVLVGLFVIWLDRVSGRDFKSSQELASVAAVFFGAVIGVELVLAIVVVPAATAGAVCQEKQRGELAVMMVTDLSDAEIVLGKLASRLALILGVVACGLPVLAILTSLGGVDPVDTLSSTMVIVGVAILGVSVSMTFSVWATKPHEALMATYAAFAVWLLALLVWTEAAPLSRVPRGGAPYIMYLSNPFWLLFGSRWFSSPPAGLAECGGFLAGAVAISVLLALYSMWRIRAVTLRQTGRLPREPVPPLLWLRAWLGRRVLRETSLDEDPVFWREVHRRQPSNWTRAIWILYGVLSAICTALAIYNWDIAPGTGGFMISFGLLIVSVTSATALAEERSRGSLDVLMATPLSTRAIVLGKWRGAFRIVPRLAILPGVLAFATACRSGGVSSAIPVTALIAALVLAYGAAFTSLGLALATWQARLGRAVGLSVGAYITATVIYPAIVLVLTRTPPVETVLFYPSPFFGLFTPLARVTWHNRFQAGDFVAMFCWVLLTAAIAYALVRVILAGFDRLLGRVPEVRRPATARLVRGIPMPSPTCPE